MSNNNLESFKDFLKKKGQLPMEDEIYEVYETEEVSTNTIYDVRDMLLDKVKGQDNAVNTFIKGLYASALLENKPSNHKPYASFFFFGPPGTGKTYLATTASELLNYPCMVFNMAEYAHEGDQIGLIGSDSTWKGANKGHLTNFIQRNLDEPHIVILDEIEKAHKTTLNIFLSALGQGTIDDIYLRQKVSCHNTIFIFTSNAGKALYDDPSKKISSLAINTVIDALQKEKDLNGDPKLSAEFCSRMASGYVALFDHLGVSPVLEIIDNTLCDTADRLEEEKGIDVKLDRLLSKAILYRQGSTDARILSDSARRFIQNELFEVSGLLNDDKQLKEVNIKVKTSGMPKKLSSLFNRKDTMRILAIVSDELVNNICNADENIEVIKVNSSEELKEALKNNIDLAIADPYFGGVNDKTLSITDYNSKGVELFYELIDMEFDIPAYIIVNEKEELSSSDKISLINDGAKKVIVYSDDIEDELNEIINDEYLEKQISTLMSQGWSLDYRTRRTLTKDNTCATITVTDFKKYMNVDSTASGLIVTERPRESFDDVIGASDAKAELKYFIDYMKNPLKYLNKTRTPKGVLLFGPPGTGKTMLARAMAKEAEVNYMAVNASDLISHDIGGAIDNIENLFMKARKYAPTIIFIDEIDAIGKKRSGTVLDSVLNALLTQMDGFKQNRKKPVFVLAATNYGVDGRNSALAEIDSALIRRFDSKIFVDLPNREERKEYIRRYLKDNGKKVDEGSVDSLADCSIGLSLAILQNILELSLRTVVRDNREFNGELLMESFDEYNAGEKREYSKEYYYSAAIHETGHAIVGHTYHRDPAYITIEARSSYGGYVNYGEEKNVSYTLNDALERIRCALAGRASEEEFFGKDGINSGASNDLLQATQLAKLIIGSFGLDDTLMYFDVDEMLKTDMSDKIYTRISEILNEQYEITKQIIRDNKDIIERIAKKLVEKNHLTGSEFLKMVK